MQNEKNSTPYLSLKLSTLKIANKKTITDENNSYPPQEAESMGAAIFVIVT